MFQLISFALFEKITHDFLNNFWELNILVEQNICNTTPISEFSNLKPREFKKNFVKYTTLYVNQILSNSFVNGLQIKIDNIHICFENTMMN
jgi:hypothetical protein